MNRTRRWGIRIGLVLIALATTTVVGGLLLLRSSWVRDQVLAYAEQQATRYVDGEIALGRLSGNLMTEATITDVVITQDGREIIRIDEVRADYAVGDLIDGEVDIARITATRPAVHAVESSSGWNLATLIRTPDRSQPETGSNGTVVRVDTLRLVDAVIAVEPDRATESGVRIPGRIHAEGELSLMFAPGGTSIAVDRLRLRTDDPRLEVGTLSGTVHLGDTGVAVDDLVVETGASRLQATARYEHGGGARRLDLYADADVVSLTELAAFVPALAGYDLAPHLRLETEGPLDDLRVTMRAADPRAGVLDATLTTDIEAPGLTLNGNVTLVEVDLATVTEDDLRSRLSGSIELNLSGESWSVESLRGTIDVEGRDLEMSGYQVDRLEATADLTDDGVGVDLGADAYHASTQMSGTVVLGDPIAYDLGGSVDELDLRMLPDDLDLPALDSDLAGRFEVAGEGANTAAHLRFRRSELAGMVVGDGALARVDTGGDDLAYGFEGRVDDADLERLGRALGVTALSDPRYASDLDGQLVVQGTGVPLDAGRVDVSADLDGSTMSGADISELSVEATLDAGRLDVASNGRVAGVDLTAVRDGVPGRLQGRFTVRGSMEDPSDGLHPDRISGEAVVELHDSSFGDIEIGNLHLDASYADQLLQVRTLSADGPDIAVEASGPLALDARSESSLDYEIAVDRLAGFGPVVGRDLGGRLTVTGTAVGHATTIRASGEIDGSSLRVDDLVDVLALEAAYDARLADLDLGTLNVDAEIDATLPIVAGYELTHLRARAGYAHPEVTFGTTMAEDGRTTTAEGRVVLHPERQELVVDAFAVETADVAWHSIEGRDITVQYRGDLVTVEGLRLVNGRQEIRAGGTVALGGTTIGRLEATLEAVDLRDVGAALLLERRLAGRADATLHVEGPASSLVVRGSTSIADGGIDAFLFDTLEATVELAGDRAEIDATVVQRPGARLEAHGVVPTGDTGVFDLSVRAPAIDLSAFPAVTETIADATGSLQLDVELTGTAADPRVDGTLQIRDGSLTVVPTGVSYTDLTAAVRFDSPEVDIDHLEVRDDGGHRLTISGTLTAEGQAVDTFEVSATADEFTVLDNDIGDVAVHADLDLRGTVALPRLDGTIRLQSGRIEVDTLLERMTSDPYRMEDPAPEAEQPEPEAGTVESADRGQDRATAGFYGNLASAVQVEVPDNLVLRGTDIRSGVAVGLGDMNVTVGGDFELRKTAPDPLVLVGEVTTVRGTYDFQGRRFTVQRDGRIRFEGTRPIDPSLDLQADREISGIVAHVNVSGTARMPRLDLSSDPPLDEADILSLIVFNRPANQIGEGERASLGELAAPLATGLVLSPITETVGDVLDLDLFEVEANPEAGAPAVTLGEQIGQRTFLRFRQQLGSRDATEFLLEYRLSDVLRLQGAIAEGQRTIADPLSRRVERGGIDVVLFFSY